MRLRITAPEPVFPAAAPRPLARARIPWIRHILLRFAACRGIPELGDRADGTHQPRARLSRFTSGGRGLPRPAWRPGRQPSRYSSARTRSSRATWRCSSATARGPPPARLVSSSAARAVDLTGPTPRRWAGRKSPIRGETPRRAVASGRRERPPPGRRRPRPGGTRSRCAAWRHAGPQYRAGRPVVAPPRQAARTGRTALWRVRPLHQLRPLRRLTPRRPRTARATAPMLMARSGHRLRSRFAWPPYAPGERRKRLGPPPRPARDPCREAGAP